MAGQATARLIRSIANGTRGRCREEIVKESDAAGDEVTLGDGRMVMVGRKGLRNHFHRDLTS